MYFELSGDKCGKYKKTFVKEKLSFFYIIFIACVFRVRVDQFAMCHRAA